MNNTNRTLEKLGGVGAIYGAIVYVVAIVLFLIVLDYPNVTEPAEKIAMIVNNLLIVIVIRTLSYILFGLFLVVIAQALYERLHEENSSIMKIATLFAFIWATLLIASGLIFNHGATVVAGIYSADPERAILLWQSIEVISSALSFIEGELLGGVWVLLVGLSALKSTRFSKGLSLLSVGLGVVGVISIIPFLNILGAVFGIGQIIWFVWIGLSLLKGTTNKKQLQGQ